MTERGASLLEMLFAIGLLAFALPFIYRQVSNTSAIIDNVRIAKQIISDSAPVKNHLFLHSEDFIGKDLSELVIETPNMRVLVANDGTGLSSFVISTTERDILKTHSIAALIGEDAAVVESDGIAYSAFGDWAVKLPGVEHGQLVYRIAFDLTKSEMQKFLHRTNISDSELSTMMRELSMGNNSIRRISSLSANRINATELDINLIRVGLIATNSLYFIGGLNLNPDKSIFKTMRVMGDLIGFRNIFTNSFASPNGTVTADRAIIGDKITVSNRFEVKSAYSRTISGFIGLSASNIRTAFLDTTTLTFMPGFGIVVSSELMYSSTPPIRIGNWNFPNSNNVGPRFTTISIGGSRIQQEIPDFSQILKDGWRNN